VRSQFRFVFVVLYLTAVLIISVYLRCIDHRNFYKVCRYQAERGRLKQQLMSKQLRLEGLLNPAAIAQRFELQLDDD